MKKGLPPAAVAVALVAVLAVIGYFGFANFAGPPPGPPEEIAKLTRADMERQRAAGPPKGERPLPGTERGSGR